MPRTPALMAVRSAVRTSIADLAGGSTVLVACSGGPDSLALAAAAAWVGERAGLRVGGLVVDHRLQPGSGAVAEAAAGACRGLGLDPVEIVPVDVVPSGDGPESDARTARYAAIAAAGERHGAQVVLVGHIADDQAEQVLMGLVRGAGTRSLAGIPPVRGVVRRPLLGLSRAQTVAACAEAGLTPWADPHNDDRKFLRVRARQALVSLDTELGPGVVAGLTRTAALCRIDADYLDGLAGAAARSLGRPPWPVADLAALALAVRSRVWRIVLIAAGAPAGSLALRHTDECDRLLTAWHGQGPIDLPGALAVSRDGGEIVLTGPR